MQSRNVVRLLALALLLSVLPAAAHASKGRMEAMHLMNQYTMDRLNVQTFPTSLYQNQNLVFGELGMWDDGSSSDFDDPETPSSLGNADRSVGLYMGNLWEGRGGVFGIELNENSNPLSPTTGADFVNRENNESFALFWANQFGGTTFGLEVNRTYSKLEDKTSGAEFSVSPYDAFGLGGAPTFAPSGSGSNTWEVFTEAAEAFSGTGWNSFGGGAGLGFERQTASGNTNLFEISVEARSYTTKSEDVASQQVLENDNGISFAANARAMLQANQTLTWVPYLGFQTTDLSWKFTDGVTPANNVNAENTMTGFEGGIAGNWNLRQNDLLVLGAVFKSTTIEWKDPAFVDTLKYTYTQPVCLFASFEGQVFSWMTWRMGATKPVFASLKIEDPNGVTFFGPTDETLITDSPFNFAVGTGFHFGNFTVDTVLNQDWTFTGGPLASNGDNAEIFPFGRISATYRY